MRTREGLNRFITYTDAVVAISITLLVLPLVDIAANADNGASVADLFTDHSDAIYAFLLSFLVITRLWLGHHRLVEYVENYDTAFLMGTIVWMLTVVMLPFLTEVISVYGKQRLAMGLYMGVIAISSITLTLLTLHVKRTPALRVHKDDEEALSVAPVAVNSILISTAWLVAMILFAVGYYAFLLLLLSGPIISWWNHRQTPGPSSKVSAARG